VIKKIGIICQDVVSLGFLRGLQARLGCVASTILPPANVGATQIMTLKQKRVAFTYFREQGVDMVVRFTDADRKRWQDVQRSESEGFPADFQQRVVCGVAADNPEDWLALVPEYLVSKLPLDVSTLRSGQPSAAIKKAIGRAPRATAAGDEDVVRRLVTEAPGNVFKRWLQDDAFKQFYQDCHSIAIRLGCEPEPANEL
jgi:hypothetical protein